MITNVDLVRRALSLINVLGVGEAAEPEQSEHAIGTLNQILADWRADGVDLQFYAQTMDDLPSACPIPADCELAVIHYLAIAEAPHYGRPIPPALSLLADKYYSRLTRDAQIAKLRPVRLDIPQPEGLAGHVDISNF